MRTSLSEISPAPDDQVRPRAGNGLPDRSSLLAAVRSGDWRAAEAWLTRVYGHPVEPIEVSSPDALDLIQLSSSELEVLRLRLLKEWEIEQGNVYPLRRQRD